MMIEIKSKKDIILTKEEFERIFYLYYERLIKYTYVKTKELYVSEEIVQNFFSKLPNKIKWFDKSKETLENWLYGCIRKEIGQFYRDENRILKHRCEFDENIHSENSLEQRNFKLNELEMYLEPIEMEYVYLEFKVGFSAKEIATILKINETARKRFRKKLMEKLKKYFEGD